MSGSHTRSLNNQRRPKPRERTSDGQPENLVGRFGLFGIGIKQTQVLGGLDVPHHEQAHSYNWIEHNLKKQVGCQAAFASRLAHRKAKAKDRSLRQLLHNERKLEYRF